MIGSSNSSWREAREKAQSQRTYVGASRRPVVQIDVEKRRLALKVPDSPVSRRKSLPGGVSFCPKGVNALAVAMAGVMDKQPPRRPATSSEYSSSTCSSSLKIRTLCTSVEDSLDSAGAFPQQKPSSFARDSQSVGRSSDASITTCSAPTMKKGLLSQRVARITSKPVRDAASYRNPSKRLSHTTGSELSVNSKEVEHNESSSPAPVLASAPVLQQWKLRETRNLESFRPSCVRSLVTDTAQSSIAPASLIETDPISNQQVCHENFVRRNLSKNKAASKYRAVPNLHKMKMQAREASRSEAKLGTKRFRGNNSSSPGLFDSSDSEIEKRDCGAHATCSADGSDAEDSTASSISTDGARPENMPVVVGGGLKVWGLDPLELSLQAIEQQASNQFSLANSVVRDSTRVKSDHSSMNTTTTDPSRKIRGINLEVSSKSLRKGPLNHINVCVESSSAPAASANYSDETLMNYAPNCTGHQMPAKLLTVKKSGRNKVQRSK